MILPGTGQPDDGEALLAELEAMFRADITPAPTKLKNKTRIPFADGRTLATAREAASYLGMTTRDIVAAVKRGKLCAIKVRGSSATARLRFSKQELLRFRQECGPLRSDSLSLCKGLGTS